MDMNKKAISAVVATILIVLISVVAVVLIWQVLKSALKGTAEQIAFSCVSVDLNIPEAVCKSGSEKLKVTLNSGKIDKLKVIFYDSDGDSIGNPQELTDVPAELVTKVYTAADLDFTPNNQIPSAVNVAAVIKTESREEQNCGLVLQTPKAC